MKNNAKLYRGILPLVGIALLAVGMTKIGRADEVKDFLYVGDGFDDTVKRFDAISGRYLGLFVTPRSGGLHGPRGLIFDGKGHLLVVNQNVFEPFNGEVIRYNAHNGFFESALVPKESPDAPFGPRGMVEGK